jgi:hypothetical protein
MTKKALLVVAVIALIMTGLFVFMPEDVLMEPRMTPLAYLGSKPYVTLFGTWVLSVPSSTLFVYALGVQIIVLGVTLNRRGHTTWAWSLIFWGIGTILAGTSYQAFGYELKCAGRDYCLFTSWFELAYLFSTAISIALMGYAFSEDLMPKASGILFRKVIGTALVLYTFLLMLGAASGTRFLISYELFTLFWMPFFVFYFIRNIINFTKTKSGVDKAFIVFWLFFLGVNVSYYVYHFLGLTDWLYTSNGLWFSDNDVLHVGLILWFLFFQIRIMPELDMTEGHHD